MRHFGSFEGYLRQQNSNFQTHSEVKSNESAESHPILKFFSYSFKIPIERYDFMNQFIANEFRLFLLLE